MINIKCPCGKTFSASPSRVGRTKYCSLKCKHKYAKRRKGLKYKIKVKNPTWFQKDSIPWNKGKESSFLPQYKGEKSTINTTHKWVYRWFGKPKKCEFCGSTRNIEWSNKTEKYRRIREDWQNLCKKCHNKYDYEKFKKREKFYKKGALYGL